MKKQINNAYNNKLSLVNSPIWQQRWYVIV